MTPDLKTKLAKVLTAFGMYEAGQQCTAPRKRISMDEVYCAEHREINDHDIPVPELTPELAWRVLIAAANKFYRCEIAAMDELHSENYGCIVNYDGSDEIARAYGKTPEEALIAAIAAALEPTKGWK